MLRLAGAARQRQRPKRHAQRAAAAGLARVRACAVIYGLRPAFLKRGAAAERAGMRGARGRAPASGAQATSAWLRW